MSRVYTVVFDGFSATTAADLFELRPAANKNIRILGYNLAQEGVADVGDAEEEMLEITIERGHTTSGSGGATPTPRPVIPTDPAAGFGADTKNTTIASAGTSIEMYRDGVNVRGGSAVFLPDKMQIECANAEFLVVRLKAAPADAILLCGTVWVEEL